MTAPKLMPCPFCGETDVITIKEPLEKDGLAMVLCLNCYAEAPLNYENGGWNTRTDLSQAAIAAAMMGVADIVRNQMKDAGDHPTARAMARVYNALADDIVASITTDATDATAALEAVKAQANHDGYDRCKERAAQLIEALFIGEGAVQLAAQIRAMEGSQLCE